MTSKISRVKLIRTDLKRRSWLLMLSSLASILLFPVRLQIELERIAHTNYGELSSSQMADIIASHKSEAVLDVLGSGNALTMITILIAAVFCAVTGFSYLHSRVEVDFYHSIPLKKRTILLTRYTGGLIIALVPYIISVLIAAFAVGTANNAVNGQLAASVMKSMGMFALAFAAVYSVCVIAMMLTGRVITGVLSMILFFGYAPVCSMLVTELMQHFFRTYYTLPGEGSIWIYFSPFTLLTRIGALLKNGTEIPFAMWAVLVLYFVGGLLLSIFIYEKRPSEAAQSAFCFPVMEAVIKVAVSIPGGLVFGLMIEYFIGYDSTAWFRITSLTGAFLICCAIDFVYSYDIRGVFQHIRSVAAAIAGTAVVMFIFISDPFGYDRYLPETEDIAAMSLYNYQITEPLLEYAYYDENSEAYFLENGGLSNYAPVYSLVREGIQAIADGNENAMQNEIVVGYFLKDGSEVYRRYYVSQTSLAKTMNTLSENEDFREKYYPSNWDMVLNAEGVLVTDWQNFGTEYQEIQLDEDELQELIGLYCTETDKLTYEQLENSQPEVTLDFLYTSKPDNEELYESYVSYETNCYIYPEHEKTLEFLRDHGMEEDALDVSDVNSLTIDIYDVVQYEAYEEGESSFDQMFESSETESAAVGSYSYIFTEEEDISRILSSVRRGTYSYNAVTPTQEGYISLMMKDGSYRSGYFIITDEDAFNEVIDESYQG